MSLAHLTLATRDVEATARFFGFVLGWTRLSMPSNIATNAAWMDVGQGVQVHLLEVEDFHPSEFEQEYGRHIAFLHPADDWSALQSRIVEAGSRVESPLRPTDFPRLFFRDPNGYLIEAIQREAHRPDG